MAAPVIILLGPPGSGKGTQAAILARKLRGKHLSSGEILRRKGDPLVLSRLATGKLARSNDFFQAVDQVLREVPSDQVLILDGVGRMRKEVEWLQSKLAELGRPIKKVIHIGIDQNESLKRNSVRGRLEDAPEAQDKRWREYFDHMRETMGVYRQVGLLYEIDGMGTVDQVASRIEGALK